MLKFLYEYLVLYVYLKKHYMWFHLNQFQGFLQALSVGGDFGYGKWLRIILQFFYTTLKKFIKTIWLHLSCLFIYNRSTVSGHRPLFRNTPPETETECDAMRCVECNAKPTKPVLNLELFIFFLLSPHVCLSDCIFYILFIDLGFDFVE